MSPSEAIEWLAQQDEVVIFKLRATGGALYWCVQVDGVRVSAPDLMQALQLGREETG
jgi:hypothetical protein